MGSAVPARYGQVQGRLLLAGTLLALNLCDLALTRSILDLGGRETNPLMRVLMDEPGTSLGMKTGVLLAVVVASIRAGENPSRMVDSALPVAVLIYTVIVMWNCSLLVTI